MLGVSTHSRPSRGPAQIFFGPDLDAPEVQVIREMHGGQLAPPPVSQPRWYLRDVESAERRADGGGLQTAARLMRHARQDGVYAGVLSTRTGGLVRLPKVFRGNSAIVQELELGHDSVRSVFDEMFPPAELALLAADGLEIGVGVGELLPVAGRDFPVFVRLDPEFLQYRWAENRWYYRSIAGMLPITPGDGRWVLHIPGGRVAPWHHGLWRAIGRAVIRKEHAALHKDNWEGKLANPARAAVSPQGASEEQKQSWFRAVMAWGVNTVFGMTPGYDVKLVESNGRGHESFEKTIERSNEEIIIAVAGQLVTTDGGAGFQNSDIHKSIRADLIKETADGLAHTINTQGLPSWVIERFGEEALDTSPTVQWDVTPSKDRNAEAQAHVTTANAIKGLREALRGEGVRLDVTEMARRFAVPVGKVEAQIAEVETEAESAMDVQTIERAIQIARDAGIQPTKEAVARILKSLGVETEPVPAGAERIRIDLAPTDVARVVRAREARASQGLPPLGDDRDEKTIGELAEGSNPEIEETEEESEEAAA